MATTTFDLGETDDPLPTVGVRLDGPLGEPILIIPGAILSPEAAFAYAQNIFAAAAAYWQAQDAPVAGHA